MHRPAPSRRTAFTLIEMSIVIVIIGLLVGGVLAGQSLIRAAQLRSVSTDFQRFQAALNAFEDKYKALPGDMTNATAIWGAASSCQNGTRTGTQTCNGDGDGYIRDPYTASSAANDYWEAALAWQHLANAGLIEGNYTGISNAAQPFLTIGSSTPAAKVDTKAGYTMISQCPDYFANNANGTGTGNCWGPQSLAKAAIMLGSLTEVTRGATILKPEEAYNIDRKMDDGLPDQGDVQSGNSPNSCYSPSTSPAAYNVTKTTKVCDLTYIMLAP